MMKIGRKELNMKLEDEKIIELYEELVSYVDEYLSEDRARKVLALMKEYEDQILIAPASTRTTYHAAYPGGWLVHTLSVIRFALETFDSWERMGIKVDFKKENAVFVSILHCFGKLGLDGMPYYLMHPQFTTRFNARKFSTRFKGGKKTNKAYWETILYTVNEDLPYMKVSDLTLHILQKAGFQLSLDEFLAIKLSEGIFDENNKVYFANSFNSVSLPKLVMLLTMSNWMSIELERDDEVDGKSNAILNNLKGAL